MNKKSYNSIVHIKSDLPKHYIPECYKNFGHQTRNQLKIQPKVIIRINFLLICHIVTLKF